MTLRLVMAATAAAVPVALHLFLELVYRDRFFSRFSRLKLYTATAATSVLDIVTP